ncbi:hypothetical protein [Micromonospora citrea]|uniref:hypothetical protein n=1 Tax=Micromonospora citrea TaxID=47855 RepID=UPI001FE14FB6|nr:hypothetical protein [Micromonospora citrea]
MTFEEYVGSRGPALSRLARLLAGDHLGVDPGRAPLPALGRCSTAYPSSSP